MFIAEFQCNARITFFQVKNDFCGIHINADCHAGNKMGDIFLLNEIIVHTAAASGRWCGAERPLCGLSNSRH